MSTKLIQLSDGTLVEAAIDPSEATQVSGGAADRVSGALECIEPLLVRVCTPIAAAWRSISGIEVDSIEVELGLSFEGEGNIFISKAKAGANLTVTLSLSRKE